jgi:hypothetical protein
LLLKILIFNFSILSSAVSYPFNVMTNEESASTAGKAQVYTSTFTIEASATP